jgi:hypothetical protein
VDVSVKFAGIGNAAGAVYVVVAEVPLLVPLLDSVPQAPALVQPVPDSDQLSPLPEPPLDRSKDMLAVKDSWCEV